MIPVHLYFKRIADVLKELYEEKIIQVFRSWLYRKSWVLIGME